MRHFVCMSGYAKLFSEIVDSSIWDEDSDTCKVWITLLALSDADGYVRGSEGWLAGKSRVSVGKCVLALRKFSEPDLRSRTPDNEGKRIERLEDGWLILNYIAFRDRLSNDPQAIATRERVRKHRERYNALRNEKSVTCALSASASASVQGKGVQGETDSYHKDARTVLHILNGATGKHFRELDCNLSVISARLNEPGITLEGVKAMIKRQCERWQNTQMAEYLQPSTLFGKQKFDSYYASKDMPVIHEGNGHASIADLRAALKIKQDQAREIKNRYTFRDSMGDQWQDADKRKEYLAMRSDIEKLEQRIAAAVQ